MPPVDDDEPLTTVQLTEVQIDEIVNRAVNKVFDRIYVEVGKSVVRKVIWALGLATAGLLLWLHGKDALPK